MGPHAIYKDGNKNRNHIAELWKEIESIHIIYLGQIITAFSYEGAESSGARGELL